jgi:3-keto-L-gulonate-6-phosphate decarboxylase
MMSSPADWPVSAEGAGTPEAALQLALDLTSLDRAAELVAKLSPTLARIEIGTPLAIASGLAAIDRIRPLPRPGAVIVADVKICDAGEKIARSAYAAGADVVTVVAPAIDHLARRSRRGCGSGPQRPRSGASPGRHRRSPGRSRSAGAAGRLAVAGKLTPAQARPALEAGFGTLIVGGAVTDADDPIAVWDTFRSQIRASLVPPTTPSGEPDA